MIRKEGQLYKVVSEKGKNLGSGYPTLDAAKRRLAEVEKFKHMRASGYFKK